MTSSLVGSEMCIRDSSTLRAIKPWKVIRVVGSSAVAKIRGVRALKQGHLAMPLNWIWFAFMPPFGV
eukprot:7646565-Prorocentrum_lima.AAC.1